MPGPVSRCRSGPLITAAFSCPVKIRFAAVDSLLTICMTIVLGRPSVAVVAPPGPHVYPFRRTSVYLLLGGAFSSVYGPEPLAVSVSFDGSAPTEPHGIGRNPRACRMKW